MLPRPRGVMGLSLATSTANPDPPQSQGRWMSLLCSGSPSAHPAEQFDYFWQYLGNYSGFDTPELQLLHPGQSTVLEARAGTGLEGVRF